MGDGQRRRIFMKQRRPYAGEVTKDYLQSLGVQYVSPSGNIVIKDDQPVTISFSSKAKRPYGMVNIGAEAPISVHVLNYVWNKADKPLGMVIDHIDNNPSNNDISNLQCITQRENSLKENPTWNTKEIKCKLNKPRSFYEDKLNGYLDAYEKAKEEHNAELAHMLRINITHTRGRLRYYDSHILEAEQIKLEKEKELAQKQKYHEDAAKKKELKLAVDSARKYYKQICEAYGKDDEYALKLWGEWKLAIAMYHGFCSGNKIASET